MRILPERVLIREDNPGIYVAAAEEFIAQHDLIGLAVVKDYSAPVFNGTLYTLLGGLLMHSEKPNCMLLTEGPYWTLWATQDIFINHALSINTKLYDL